MRQECDMRVKSGMSILWYVNLICEYVEVRVEIIPDQAQGKQVAVRKVGGRESGVFRELGGEW